MIRRGSRFMVRWCESAIQFGVEWNVDSSFSPNHRNGVLAFLTMTGSSVRFFCRIIVVEFGISDFDRFLTTKKCHGLL